MTNDLIRAKQLLLSDSHTCVLCKEAKLYTSDLRGVKPLVLWYEGKEDFSLFSAADKVVGRGAAFLYVLLGVKAVFANIISQSALEVLKENNIEASYDTLVNNIINRKGDGICPFEEAVLNITDKNEAYKIIKAKMEEMNIK